MTDTLLPATRRRLLQRLARAQVDGRAPSMTAGLARDGRLLWCDRRGVVAPDAAPQDVQYRVGSLSKTFTAVLVMRLREEGLLDLADPVSAHLDRPDLGSVSVSQLLSHTGGVSAETPPPWWERVDGRIRPELADVVGSDGVRHPPGRTFHYSNPGFALLGGIVERLRRVSWVDAVRAEILEPLGMDRTTPMPEHPHASGWAVHPWADTLLPEPTPFTGHMAPAGQLWSTATDLAVFGELLSGRRPEVLSATAATEMRRPTSPVTDPSWSGSWGLGVQLARVGGRTVFGHTGSMPGFVSAFWIDPDEQLTAITFANSTSGSDPSGLAFDLMTTMADAEPLLPAEWVPATGHDPDLVELLGPWYWGSTSMGLRLLADGRLSLDPLRGRGRAAVFAPRGDGTYIGENGYYDGEILTFVRDDTGRLTHLDIGSFVFTRPVYDPSAPVPGGVDPDGWRGWSRSGHTATE